MFGAPKYIHLLTHWSFQITLWLQGLFLFCIVWTVGGTVSGDSKKAFDEFFRYLISGVDDKHPKPKSIKITKVWILLEFLFNFPFSGCRTWCIYSYSYKISQYTVTVWVLRDVVFLLTHKHVEIAWSFIQPLKLNLI